MTERAKRWLHIGAVMAVLALAAALRLAPIGAALPYTDYIDEGYVLSQVIDQLNMGTLECRWYGYPTLTSSLTTGAMRVAARFYQHVYGQDFREALPSDKERYLPLGLNYNLISPPELILIGRVVVAVFGLATVLLAGEVGRQLGGATCGLLAMLLTAVCPALVLRSSNIIVDTTAAFFVLVSLYFAIRLARRAKSEHAALWRHVALAGGAAGLAVASKYTAGAVLVAAFTTAFTLDVRWREKLRLALVAGAAFTVAAVCANPSFIQHLAIIQSDMQNTGALYRSLEGGPSYWHAALSFNEIGLPLVAAGVAGLALMLWQRATRVVAISWLVFTAVLLAPLVRLSFQPFRNLMPLMPPVCIAAAVFFHASAGVFRRWAGSLARYLVIGVALFTAALSGVSSIRQVREKLARVDTRVVAVDWLAAHTNEQESILVIDELVVLPPEWKRVAAKVTVVPWLNALDTLERERFDYLVGSEMDVRDTTEPEWAPYLQLWERKVAGLPVSMSAGHVRCPVYPYFWRTNDLRVIVWKLAAPAQGEPVLSTR